MNSTRKNKETWKKTHASLSSVTHPDPLCGWISPSEKSQSEWKWLKRCKLVWGMIRFILSGSPVGWLCLTSESMDVPNRKVLLSEELRAGETEWNQTFVSKQEAEAGTQWWGQTRSGPQERRVMSFHVPALSAHPTTYSNSGCKMTLKWKDVDK